MPVEFTREELLRCNKRMIVSEIGKEGQHEIKKATVFVAGFGASGSNTSYHLAAKI